MMSHCLKGDFTMDKFEDYDVLYGYSSATGVQTEIPNTLEDVANYIVREGLTGDVLITTPLDTPVLNTMGFFVDQCADSEYMEALRPVLIEKQSNLDQFLKEDEQEDSPEEPDDEEQPEI